MPTRILASLLVLGSAAFLLTNCGSSDSGTATPSAGDPGVAGAGAGAPPVAAGTGGAAAGAPAAGSPAVGGGGSAGAPAGGAPGTAGSGASAGASQSGSGGASAGTAGAATGGGSSAGAGGQGAFALTSSKLTAGMAFPPEFTCAMTANHSPPLSWTPGPSAALSYALGLLDTANSFNHWVVWDIPPSTTMLPESLPTTAMLSMPAGAKQASGQGMGYLGPCPSGTVHTYKFTLYALDVAMLPGVTTSTATKDIAAAIEMHDIASATLSATSDAKKP